MSWLDLVYGKETRPLVSDEVPLPDVGAPKGDWPLRMAFGEEDLLEQEIYAGEEDVEETMYRVKTKLDERVCPLCAPWEGVDVPESALQDTFPNAEFQADGTVKLNIHEPRDPHCRCEAEVVTADMPYFDPNANRWRDPVTGGFTQNPNILEQEVMQYNAWATGGF